MAIWLNHHECMAKLIFRVACQHPLEFSMYCGLFRWEHAQIDDTRTGSLHEHQIAIITITCHKKSPLFLRHYQQLLISCLRQPDLGYTHHIMTETPQKMKGHKVNVVVE